MLRGHNRNTHPEGPGLTVGLQAVAHLGDGSEVLAPGGLPWVLTLRHPGHFLTSAVPTSVHLSSYIWASGESAGLKDEHPLRGECLPATGSEGGGTHQTRC